MQPQEQNQPQPQQPMQMQGPQPGSFTPSPTMGAPVPKKGLSKGALWGIIGGGVGLLLLIVGVILAVVFLGGPGKEDYRKANETLNDAKSAYSDLSSFQYISSYGVTDTTAKNSFEKIQSSLTKVDAAVSDLGKMKALNDKDVKDMYNKLNDRMPSFDKAMGTVSEVYDKIMPVMVKMNSATSSYTTSDAMLASITNVRKDLEALDLKYDVNKTYVSELITQIKVLEVVIPKKIAMTNDYTKYDSSVNTQYYDATDKLNSLDKDWQSNLEKVITDGEIKDQLNDLGDLLYDKYMGVKK